MNDVLPKITTDHLLIDLMDSKNLGDPGPGGPAFNLAIQNMNRQNTTTAIQNFHEALSLGLDPLRQGYAYANLGTLYIKNDDLLPAVTQFIKVFEPKQVLYESAHESAQYLTAIYQAFGRNEEAALLERLAIRTQTKLGYGMAPEVIAKLHQLVSQYQQQPFPIPPEGEPETGTGMEHRSVNERLFNLRPLHQMNPQNREAKPNLIPYHHDTWDFYLEYPANWSILWENDTAGSWIIPIALAGPTAADGKPCFIVNLRQEEVLYGSPNFRMTTMLSDGRVIELPSTPEEFIELNQQDLARSFAGFQFDFGEETRLAGKPAARLVYSYDGQTARIKEEMVTVFGTGITYQFISEVPASQYGKYKPVFDQILRSFRFGGEENLDTSGDTIEPEV